MKFYYWTLHNHWDILQPPPPPTFKSPSQLTFLFKPNATMNYHDSQWCNNECNNLYSYFSFIKPALEAFLIHLYLKDYPTHEGGEFTYGFSTGIPLDILIVYYRDPNYSNLQKNLQASVWLDDVACYPGELAGDALGLVACLVLGDLVAVFACDEVIIFPRGVGVGQTLPFTHVLVFTHTLTGTAMSWKTITTHATSVLFFKLTATWMPFKNLLGAMRTVQLCSKR